GGGRMDRGGDCVSRRALRCPRGLGGRTGGSRRQHAAMDAGPRALAPACVSRPGRRGRPSPRVVALGVQGPRRPDHRPRYCRSRPVRRLGILLAAAVTYLFAAWMVAPGFYDGFGPPQPYSWTCPPPQAGANVKPSSGHLDIKVINGVSDANSAFTEDGQVVIGFLPGAFDSTGKTTISVDIVPLDSCPKPPGISFVTNVYKITASAPPAKGKTAGLTLRYSNLEPDPSDVYQASDPAGPWKSIGRNEQAAPFTVDTRVDSFG